jgi:DNA-directed RNA polymerase subunit RPC12/RpoP
MPRQSPTFQAITCQHCGAMVLLVAPGAIVRPTEIRCVQCSTVRIIRPIDNNERKGYSIAAPA